MHSQVLLVDDEPTFRRIIGRYLARDGFDVMTARNGREALALALERRFDAVLTDVEMPLMDGLTLLQRLTTIFPDMPVVLMSGASTLPSREEALARGAFDYVRKPLDLEQLRRVVHGAVSMVSMASSASSAPRRDGRASSPRDDVRPGEGA